MYTEVQDCPSCLAIVRTISSRTSRVTVLCRECTSLKVSKFGQLLKAIGLWQRTQSSKRLYEPTGERAKTDDIPSNARRDVSKTCGSKSRQAIKDVNRAWISAQGLNDIYCKWTQMRKENDPHSEESSGTKDQQRNTNEGKDVRLNSVSSNCSTSCLCCSRRDTEKTSGAKRRCRSVHWADETGSSLETVHHFKRPFSFLRTFKACLKSNTDM